MSLADIGRYLLLLIAAHRFKLSSCILENTVIVLVRNSNPSCGDYYCSIFIFLFCGADYQNASYVIGVY